MFLESTCPHSVRAFGKLDALLDQAGAHREEFEFERHGGGPNMDATPNDIVEHIEQYSGLELREAFAIPDLDREVKWHAKYARQNGIHVSPTFMIDGIVDPKVGSRDGVSAWAALLGEPAQHANPLTTAATSV